MPNNKLEHIPNVVKHVADAGVGGSVILTWITTLTPFLNFLIIVLALIWGSYRIQEMRLSVKIKQKILAGENPNED